MKISRLQKQHRAKDSSILRFHYLTPLAICSLCFLLATTSVSADETESKVKAAFLYKFCNYVQWPEYLFPEENSPIVIAVAANESQMAEITSMVSNRYIKNRPLIVRPARSSDDLQGVHVLYVSRDAKTPPGKLIDDSDRIPVLTVSDLESSSSSSIITFLTINNHIRFEISLERAEEVELKLSSELLSVAHKVHDRKRK